MEESNNTGKLIGALITGAAIGGVIGIILAPNKGSKTRKKILKKSAEHKMVLKEKFNDMMIDICKDAETINEIELIDFDHQYWRS